jgi:hypothetical protein
VHHKQLLKYVAIFTFALSCDGAKMSHRGPALNATEDAVPDQFKNGKGAAEDRYPEVGPDAPGLSERAHVRFKKQQLLENDLASALELTPAELCKEFDSLSCINQVHHIALGGVDAYKNSIFHGVEESLPTTPIAMERIVLSACGERVKRDFSGGGVIFTNLPAKVTDTKVLAGSIGTLFERALRRQASADEVKTMQGLYDEVAKSTANATETWATLACYMVLTSVEAVFY